MLARLCLLAALQPALAYWQEECGGDPDEFLLPDNTELDCALRAVGLEYATGLLSNRRPGLPAAGPRIHAALNLTACPAVPIPQPSLAPAPSAGDVLAGIDGTRIANDGTIAFRGEERVKLVHLISSKPPSAQVRNAYYLAAATTSGSKKMTAPVRGSNQQERPSPRRRT